MIKTFSSIIAAMGVSLSAVAQDAPRDPAFWMTLSNKTRSLVDCSKLEQGRVTMGFMAQFESYTEEQIKTLSPQQQAWLKMTRESRSDDPRLIENLAKHLEVAHGIKRGEIGAAHQHCVMLTK